MSNSNNPRKYLTTLEVADELGITIIQARELCKWGKFPKAIQPHKHGPWLIPPQALAHFIKHNRSVYVTKWDKINFVLFGNKIRLFFTTILSVLGLLFGAISAGADMGGARQQFIQWGIFPAFPSKSNEEILIVIATFHRTEGVVDTNIQGEIRREIIETAKVLGFSNLRVEITPQVLMVDDEDKADKIGDRYNAGMVIWGEDTGVRVTVKYSSTDAVDTSQVSGIITETNYTQLANPTLYAKFVTNDLPSHLTFFALFANSEVAYVQGDRKKAIEIIEQAIDYLSSTNEPLDGIVAAYFDLAQMYFLGNQINFVPASQENLSYPESIATDDFHVINPNTEDLQQAIRYYTQTIELQPNPYTETGIVFHNRAFAECMMQEWDDCLSDFLEFYRRIHSDETESRNLANAYMARSVFRTYDNADDYDGAINDLNKAVELGVEPSCNGTYVQYYDAYVGRINNELDDRDHDGFINLSQLIEDYGKIIDLEPKECQNASIARTYLARGKAYMMIGENELATQDLRMYLQLLPEAENQAEVEELIKSMK